MVQSTEVSLPNTLNSTNFPSRAIINRLMDLGGTGGGGGGGGERGGDTENRDRAACTDTTFKQDLILGSTLYNCLIDLPLGSGPDTIIVYTAYHHQTLVLEYIYCC